VHRDLTNQLAKFIPDTIDQSQLADFFAAINTSYQQADGERQSLEYSMALTQATLDSTTAGIIVTDNKGRVTSLNQVTTALLEQLRVDDLQQILNELAPTIVDYPEVLKRCRQIFRSGIERGELLLTLTYGRIFQIVSLPQCVNGEVVGRVWNITEVTKLRTKERQVYFMAYHDALTKLPNRLRLTKDLKKAIAQAAITSNRLAVIFIDLDGFKFVNDTLGHDSGDVLLVEAAKRISSQLTANDIVSRHGGDEFIILLSNVDSDEDLARRAEAIRLCLLPVVTIDGQEAYVSGSIGIATFPEHGRDYNSLIKNADLAMYQAKRLGRNNYQFFTPAYEVDGTVRMLLTTKLKKAVHNNELEIVYQPVINAKTHKIKALEALFSWRQRDGSFIPLADFLAIAIETELIIPITERIITQGCVQMMQWIELGHDHLSLELNIYPGHFKNLGLLVYVSNAIQASGLPPEKLVLKIKDIATAVQYDTSHDLFNGLYELGVKLVASDFGCSTTSLRYFTQLPISGIDLAPSCVSNILKSDKHRALVQALIAMSKVMELDIAAIGVSNVGQQKLLERYGCSEMQGPLFGSPQSSELISTKLFKQLTENFA